MNYKVIDLKLKFMNLVKRIENMKIERELRAKEPHSDTLLAKLSKNILALIKHKDKSSINENQLLISSLCN